MATRGSLRLRNGSPAGSTAGFVHVLRASTGLPDFHATPTECDNIVGMVMENTRTITYSGSSLTTTHQWDNIPVSQDKYHAFIAPHVTRLEIQDPGMSTILMVFDHATGATQYYEISMAACYYARYRFAGPLANKAEVHPTAPLDLVNRTRDVIEMAGSAGKSLLNAVQNAATGMLGNLLTQGAKSLPIF